MPRPFTYAAPQAFQLAGTAIRGAKKVSTTLCEFPHPKEREIPEIRVDEVIDPDIAHRGRKREREIMHDNLHQLLACTGKSSKQFWNLVRGWTDTKPVKPRVMIDQLHDSFKACLNPPAEIPETFDANLHEMVTAMNNSIPRRTQDRTPQGFSHGKLRSKTCSVSKRSFVKRPRVSPRESTR
ncbi:hypothetical protein B0H13DRAFT_1912713 [Mycena leptocephala]|nr:hypothetical protein B0H13DRAFT_1912713 [Mycena leptocephala]